MDTGMISDQMGVAILVALGFLAFACFVAYQSIRQRKRIQAKIRSTYGKRPVREYDLVEFDAISHYFQQKQKKGSYIDDITWNDLDLDTIFMLMNHTWSCIGESYLYSMLRTPVFDSKALMERRELLDYFLSHRKEREEVEYCFAKVGKTGRYSVFDYIYNLADCPTKPVWKEYLWGIGILVSFASIFLSPAYGFTLFLAVMVASWVSHYNSLKVISPYVMSCSCLLQILKVSKSLGKIKAPELKKYQDAAEETAKAFRKLKRNSLFLVANGAGGGMEKVLIDYLNYTFHIDIIQFQVVVKEMARNRENLERLIDAMGMLECGTAMASFCTMMPEHCLPILREEGEIFLKADNVYHPMISDPVKNSIETTRGVLLTGSNASGKSTFLKTVAINAILAQTAGVVMADSWEGCYFKVLTSMALRDDLDSQESYFIVEIKSLKRILDEAGKGAAVLCFVDEVLRGTNTVERIAASSEILKSLNRPDVLCFAATHDIELTHILEEDYENYHFQEEVLDDDIVFNYQLFQGRATSRNAIRLLAIMGYQEEIIQNAEKRALEFMKTGEWK
ncbi:MAG TPA: hypothetical protein IAB26_11280 [Candidatus Limivivens merdigallinarum]|uniref:DNA mismatch repair proteins mutS family domain-containing protein n=1 Tax=Candidatus Limivivens merdigallinarum TaxID=2840859 RepID=A0A9D1D1D9_9FIRM|nr:hypothetical protein [Candidatus Limivivens merdigallinarum]